MQHSTLPSRDVTIGLDLGDKYSVFYVMDDRLDRREFGRVKTTRTEFQKHFAQLEPARIAMETGTHSPWASRVIAGCGHDVLVANSRQLRMIYGSHKKTDKADAEALARVARLDPELLKPVEHRSPEAQSDLAILVARDGLVEARTKLINSVRSISKSSGTALPSCSAECFHKKAEAEIPDVLKPALIPIVEMIAQVTASIRKYDKDIERLCEEKYPETQRLRQIKGVGPVTSLAFVLVLEDPRRFKSSRKVGAYLGLTPRLDDSSGRKSQLRISKAGNGFLRRLLVGSAQYIRARSTVDSDLRRHGEAIARRGGKNAKKRAAVAIARKLAVLMHRLWLSGEPYEPLRNSARKEPPGGRMTTSVA